MNAILGITRPGDFGADLMHFNPHKTFSGPHGGGGPGAGPIAVGEKLAPYLPSPTVVKDGDKYRLDYDRPNSIGRVRSFFGNTGVLVRMYSYIRTHGPDGLKSISENAVLNANYLLSRVKDILPVPQGDRCMHEFVASAVKLKTERDASAMDSCQAALGLRLPRSDRLFPADCQRGDHDRADRDRKQGDARRVCRHLAVHRPRIPRTIARRSDHDAHQPAGTKSARSTTGVNVEAARMTYECRLLRHEPAAGAWNMAVDEVLLDRAQDHAAPCLRVYGWSEPTLSLGYFQTYSDRQQHAASQNCAAVRRLTGGGAILHDDEITYSVLLPGDHPLAARRDADLYRCSAWI